MFIKLDSHTPFSSLWQDPPYVRVLWITIMSQCELDGIAKVSVSSLPRLANLTEEECQDGLKRLTSPDPHSKSKDHEGRRILLVDGGMKLVNYFRYRDAKSQDHKSEYMREYMRKYREKHKVKATKPSDWREEYRKEADEAVLIPFPETLPQEVEDALNNLFRYRHQLAVNASRPTRSIRFTSETAKAIVREAAAALVYGKPEDVAERINKAITDSQRSPTYRPIFK